MTILEIRGPGPHEGTEGGFRRAVDTEGRSTFTEIRNVTSCASVQAFIPPSTVRFAPVMYEDSGPATNATIAAISSTRP